MNVVSLIGNPAARDVIRKHELYMDAEEGLDARKRRRNVQVGPWPSYLLGSPSLCIALFDLHVQSTCMGVHCSGIQGASVLSNFAHCSVWKHFEDAFQQVTIGLLHSVLMAKCTPMVVGIH